MTADRFDGRTSAIAYGSRLVFDGIGLWPAIEREAEPIREIRVADDDSPLFLHYDHRDLGGGAAPLGYIVENRVLRRAPVRPRRDPAEPQAARAAHRGRDERGREAALSFGWPTARSSGRGLSPPPTGRTRRCGTPPVSARSNGAIARPASSRPCA